MKDKKTGRGLRAGALPVLLLSLLSLEAAIIGQSLLGHLEAGLSDMRMRWRYRLRGPTVHPSITLLAIDGETQRKFGRFGAGSWILREPYFRQMTFFGEHLKPSVLAYDIIIEGTIGEAGRHRRVSESDERLRRIMDELGKTGANPTYVMPLSALADINTLSMEQGNVFLTHSLASLLESGRFPVIMGYYFRGGALDPQPAPVRPWSDEDVFGDDPGGGEERGRRVPYLKDMAIPVSDIHFPDSAFELRYEPAPNAVLPSTELLDYTQLGFVNCPHDDDSVVRRVPLVNGFRYRNSVTRESRLFFVPSFALAACLFHLGVEFPLAEKTVEVFFGREIVVHPPSGSARRIPIDGKGRMYLNFRAKLEDFPQVSFGGLAPPVYAGSAERRKKLGETWRGSIDGRLVVVGVTTTAVDVGPYPLSASKPTALVHIHLAAADNILSGDFLAPLGRLGNALLMFFVFMSFTGLCCVQKSSRLGFWGVGYLLAYMALSYACVHASTVILPVIGPVLYVTACLFGVLTYRFFGEERARRRIRGMFSTMVSDKVLKYLEDNPGSFSLTGRQVETTVMFSDIADFARIAEELTAERLTGFLNAHFTPVADCIMAHDGFVDKYIGDGVMAVWGAPHSDREHAVKACLCALDIRRITGEMKAPLRERFGVGLRVRMGISSGAATAGNMGSEKKFQYTVIGDVVNLASRLEPVNKEFGTDIVISEQTFALARDRIVVRPLGRIVVPGKEEVVRIYEPIGQTGMADAQALEIADSHGKALERFYERDWSGCIAIIDGVLRTGPDMPLLHLRKLALEFAENPPGPDWQGEYVRKHKG